MKASRVGDVEVTRLLVAGRAILDLKSKVCVNLTYCDVTIFFAILSFLRGQWYRGWGQG